jgi:hypothetical protein
MIDRSVLLRLGVVLACSLAAASTLDLAGAGAPVLAQPSARPGSGVAVNGQVDPAAEAAEPVEPLKVHVFTFEHQSADDALGEIRPLFSDRGSVELKQGGDTVVLRDEEEELANILRALRDFDHPRRSLHLQFRLLRAHRVPFSPQQLSEGVSPALVARLKQVLRYDTYESLSDVGFVTGEGERVAYDFGDDLGMEFKVGTVLQGTRLALRDFRLVRHAPRSASASRVQAAGPDVPGLPASGLPVLHANLVLRLGQTLAMVLMRDEAADTALVIAITCDPADGEPKG